MCGYCGKAMMIRRATTYFFKYHGQEKTRKARYWCNNTCVTPGASCDKDTTIVAHIVDDEAWKFAVIVLEDLDAVRNALLSPLQNNAEAELQSIESLISFT